RRAEVPPVAVLPGLLSGSVGLSVALVLEDRLRVVIELPALEDVERPTELEVQHVELRLRARLDAELESLARLHGEERLTRRGRNTVLVRDAELHAPQDL